MVSVETVSIMIAAVSVVIGVINSIRSNQKAEEQRQTEIETRQAELLMQLYDRWSSKDFRRDSWEINTFWRGDNIADIRKKLFDQGDLDEIVKMTTQATFYEGIGVLVEEGLLDLKLVDLLLHNNIMGNWETLTPFITESRQRMEQSWDDASRFHPHYDSWERLYHRIKQMSESSRAS